MRTGYAPITAFGMLLLLAGWAGNARAEDGSPAPAATLPTTTAAPAAGAGPARAAVVTLKGVIDDHSRDALFKRFAAARKAGAEVVILRLNTNGGLATAALDISRFLKQADDLHVVALVQEKAYSAGAMIALACDEIVMEPGSYLGDAAPIAIDARQQIQSVDDAVRAKMESPILADFHDSAVKNGHDPLLAAAMVSHGRVVHWVQQRGGSGSGRAGPTRFVDAAEYGRLTAEAGAGWQEVDSPAVPRPLDGGDTLLTVSADVAREIGLAEAVAGGPEALAAQRGYTIVSDLRPGLGEKFVAMLGGTVPRGLLLVVFLLSVYVAVHTAGAGAAEAVAMISLGLLVGIPLLTGYAQWWEIVAIVVGFCLLALELFVIPGFGVAGIAGLTLVLGGLVMTFVGNSGLPGTWQLPQVWAGLERGLLAVVTAFAASGVLALWLRRYLPKLPYLNRLVLPAPAPALAGAGVGPAAVPGAAADAWPFVGTIGRAVTDLRPGGSAEFPYADDRRTAGVVSDSGFVQAGTKIAVLEVRGNRVVVRPV